MSFTPTNERALKLIEEFKNAPRISDVRLKSTARISGAFPLPEFNTPLQFNKRPFDDTILNDNDSLLKRRRSEIPKPTPTESNDDSFVAASPWEIRKMKGELIQARAEISSLEARCSKLFNTKKQDLLVYEQEKLCLQQTIENNRQTICDYETKLKTMRKREQMMKEELEGKQQVSRDQASALQESNSALREENQALKSSLSQMELKSDELSRELNSTRTSLEQTKEELKLTSEELAKSEASLAQMKLMARQHELDKAALLSAQRRIAELEKDARDYSDTASLLREQQAKLITLSDTERQLQALTAENIKLRDGPNKILKLSEEVVDLKEKLSYLDQTEALLTSTKVELARVMNELVDYRALSRGYIGDSAGHLELSSYLREMQQARLLAHSDLSTLQAKLKTAEERNAGLTSSLDEMEREVGRLRSETESLSTAMRRLRKQHSITTWERDELRKMLDSVEKETTVACADSRVEALRSLVEGYRVRLQALEQDLPPGLSEDTAATLEALRKKNTELMQKADKLEYELQHRNLKGDFDTRNTKILHLKMNPTEEALKERQDSLERAQHEVEVLREKMRILQEAHDTSQAANITQLASDQVSQAHSRQLDELREKVKSQEIQNQRLVQVFKSTSKEFREAVYSLLGYNVSTNQQSKQKVFKLSSMYSDSPDHHLVFQLSAEGNMELLETDMSREHMELVNTHLVGHNSIPLFLSAVTTKLFTHHTQSTIVID